MTTTRAILGAALAIVFCGLSLAAGVARYKLNIESQSLGAALMALSEQSGVQMLMKIEDQAVEATKTPPVVGEYTVEGALERLLANSGLKYEFVNDRTVRVSAPGDRVTSALNPTGEPVHVAQADAGTAAAAAPQEPKLEEVVVTAQKRQERLKDVPISITALSGRDLDSSTAEGVAEELNKVAGVAILQSHAGMGDSVAVRGVTAPSSAFNGSSPIAYYLDSIPFTMVRSSFAPDASAYDLDRVEVLRGPQGTLYGASALNGVVRILSKDANLNAVEFKTRELGSTTQDGGGNYRADATFNAPIIDGKLGVRVTGSYEDLSGWIDRPIQKDANDAHIGNARIKVKAQPSDNLTVDLTTWLSRNRYGAPNTGDEHNFMNSSVDESNHANYNLYGLKVGYQFSSFNLSSSTGYLDFSSLDFIDLGPYCCVGLIIDSNWSSKVLTEELLASSSVKGPWRWSLGAFYRGDKDKTTQEAGFFSGWIDKAESVAVYGEVTRQLLDGKLELTGGLREFRDHARTYDIDPSGAPAVGGASDSDDFHSLTPRVVLTGHLNNDLMVYASFAKGFRSGVLQAATAAALGVPPAKPDTLKNFEIGAKGEALNHALGFDAALYYMDWQDIQQSMAVIAPNGVPSAALANGQSASGLGFDLALTVRPVSGLTFGLNLSVNSLELDADSVTADGTLARKGERPDSSPKETYGAFAQYQFPLGSGGLAGRLSASANYISRTSSRSLLPGNLLTVAFSDSQFTSSASFGVHAAKNWDASLFVNNVTNENRLAGSNPFLVPAWDARVRPRTYGAQVEYRFE